MADRLVMGYWDCKYCGTNGIEGVKRDCPNCGHPRDKDTVFYMKSKNHDEVVRNNEYLTDKQAETKGKGADWECSFCGALNSTLSSSCKSCGHPREESDPDYFRVREREDRAAGVGVPAADVSGTEDGFLGKFAFLSGKLSVVKKILFVVLILLTLFGGWWAVTPHWKTLHIVHKEWERSISVEEYRYVADSGWSLPFDADLNRTAEEIHHYNSVLDHYEEKTRTYQERVQTGSHTEYSYTDNGDGTFTEHSYSVPDYDYVTREETYEDPVYIQVPVYETKYYYHIWRWVYSRSVETSGTDNDPYYGELILGENERESGRSEQRWLKGYTGKNSENVRTYYASRDDWEWLTPGSEIRVLLDGAQIKEIEY